MKKLLLVSLCLLVLSMTQVFAQNRTVTGTVTAKDDGLPIPGVTVKVKGTTIGTQTNAAGKFSLSIPENSTLVFSFISYETQEIASAQRINFNVVMVSAAKQLGEVVVQAAYGVQKQARAVGYASTTVDSKLLTESKVTNIANGLTGKVAGLQINTVNNGVNPDVRIVLRGNRSINGNNQALVVVDGTPVSSNFINQINPNDIDNVTVLKGAGAAAIYGSEGSNGVLLITTKRGSGAPTITYTNSTQIENFSYFPKLQREFGGGAGEVIDPNTGFYGYVPYENQSFGPKFDGSTVQLGVPVADGSVQSVKYASTGKDPRLAFFDTGLTEQNDLSYQSGDANSSFYMSAQDVYTKGIVPNDRNRRTGLRVAAMKKYGIFTTDYSIGYTKTTTNVSGPDFFQGRGVYWNVLNQQADVDLRKYQNLTDKFSDVNGFYNAYYPNPYWQTVYSRQKTTKDALVGNASFKIAPVKWFDATYKVSMSYGWQQYKATVAETDFSPYAVSDPFGTSNIASQVKFKPGSVADASYFGDGGTGYSRLQGDLFLTFKHKIGDFTGNLLLGNTVYTKYINVVTNGSNNLLINNFYNLAYRTGEPLAGTAQFRQNLIGYFGDLNIAYKDWAFLEVTGRNDKSSLLSQANRSFFYPSAKLTVVLTDAIPALKNKKTLSYAKVRGSYSKVGQVDINPYSLQNVFASTAGAPFGSTPALSLSSQLNNPNLKPELSYEKEVGLELGFLDNRVYFAGTYYNTHTKNQTFPVAISPASGYSTSVQNLGEVENYGWEFELKGSPVVKAGDFSWDLGANLSLLQNKVLSLQDGTNEFQLLYNNGTASNSYAIVGKPFPYIKGTDLVRDPQGRVVVNASTGLPTLTANVVPLGNAAPKAILGITTSFKYKFVTLSAVAEYRGGYFINNIVGQALNFTGTSAVSASAGRQRFIYPNSVIQTGANTYVPNTSISIPDGNTGFWTSSAYYNATSTYVNSAAFWKLREVALNFDLYRFIKNQKVIKGLQFGLVGRNLLLFRPKSNPWTDPEYSIDNSNAVGTTNENQTPPTRLYGASLTVKF
ncbi:TonB-linked outer membrane protein, SusC/RagA family [Mucilaginibacter gossypiicola]|uniref:TonB-linked outer membrane protein, SusC/RagA family n=1 Tax=Mucilaginibacter gossypiicola TaxID=551995 RepID=A0A1H8E7V7_9SPHI|nr:SusC/RagA family TonB-linked outer membrane protein [Mucilaginibacter gossypiicola]SEN15214.1 TonB-linked outer membrane protein, SusC/RagA family [Mucilaginibacter gossypiicola]